MISFPIRWDLCFALGALFFLLVDLEVAEFVGILIASHNSQPVPERILLQIFLRQILQISKFQ